MHHLASSCSSVKVSDTVECSLRYSFTNQFLQAATLFVNKAIAIEKIPNEDVTEDLKIEHRAYITTAIMQCAAALETEIHEIYEYGPNSLHGSCAITVKEKESLFYLKDFIDKQSPLDKYNVALKVLNKAPLPTGAKTYQNAQLLIKLRNEITHYKSAWTGDLLKKKFLKELEGKRHNPPPFTHPSQNFFPHRCLNADCGRWAISSAISFLDDVYKSLDIPNRFDSLKFGI